MKTDAGLPPAIDRLPATLIAQLPEGAGVVSRVQQGQCLILALHGANPELGWFDLDLPEPPWRPIHSDPSERAWPIQALLAHDREFLAIGGNRVSAYAWGRPGNAPERVRTARLALDGYQVLSTALTKSHLAILASRISRRVKMRDLTLWHDLGKCAPTHRRTELLLLLAVDSFRELGAAALEQRFDAAMQPTPPPRWSNLLLSETHLHLQDAIGGTIQITLRDGPVEDFQQQIHSCFNHEFPTLGETYGKL